MSRTAVLLNEALRDRLGAVVDDVPVHRLMFWLPRNG